MPPRGRSASKGILVVNSFLFPNPLEARTIKASGRQPVQGLDLFRGFYAEKWNRAANGMFNIKDNTVKLIE